MKKRKIKVFVSDHCEPCHKIKKLLIDGAFVVNEEEGHEVNLVDIETEEGFKEMVSQEGIEGVPSAYEGDHRCQIKVDEEAQLLILECPGE